MMEQIDSNDLLGFNCLRHARAYCKHALLLISKE